MSHARVVVATYNVHRCVGLDGRFDPGRTLAVLRELHADVIALQELHWQPEDALHRLDDFARSIGYTAIAGPTLHKPDGHFGNVLLTRLAVREIRRVDLSVAGREPRGALDVLLKAPGGTLRILATHLGLRPGERREQIRRVLANLTAGIAPTVLMGDLNEWFLWGRPLRWLHARFGRGPAPATFPAIWPVFALDRIWGEPQRLIRERAAHASPLARAASDHLPLRAVLALPEANDRPEGTAKSVEHQIASTDAAQDQGDKVARALTRINCPSPAPLLP